MNAISQEWWRDPRCHIGELTIDSPLLHQRDDIQPAIKFIGTELDLPANARILDLCCGPGRYAVELAHQGYDIVGLDINEQYIYLARQLSSREKIHTMFLMGDMREIPFEKHFNAIINVGTSFGFFDNEDENQQVVDAVAKSLKKEGIFLLEMGNRDYFLKNFKAKDSHRLDDGRVVVIRREFDDARSRIVTYFEVLDGEEHERWALSWRAYTLAEMVLMLKQASLAVLRVYGDWDRCQYSVDSPRMLIVSKRMSAD